MARELGRVWAARRVEKRYLALVSGHVRDDAGTIDAPIGPHPDSRVAIRNAVRPDGAAACTDYTVLERRPGPSTLLGLSPRTGRKHQLRVHLAHLGHPVVGDKLYGAREEDYLDFVAGRLSAERRAALQLPHHALHAASLAFDWRGRSWRFDAGRPGWAAAAPGNATG